MNSPREMPDSFSPEERGGAEAIPLRRPVMETTENPAVFGYTLGCKLNSYETDALVEEIVSKLNGSRTDTPEAADLIVVNTCTVTARSHGKSRRSVNSFLTRYPAARVVVTGCSASVFPGDFPSSERLLLFDNSEKRLIAGTLAGNPIPEAPSSADLFPLSAPLVTSKTRAFLKIQDGCNSRCTYCIVPEARGLSRSQPREILVRQAREIAEAGYREIGLTGVNIADYGTDLYSGTYGLPELVNDLLEVGGFRLRIGSIEPHYLSVKTLEKLALPGVCRHFHIPFQSGSDKILRKMARKYTRKMEYEFLDAIETLFPGACIGSDIIAGFPGETEDDYRESLSMAADRRINYLHVFPFSPRPGTPAAKMKPVHPETVTKRAEELRNLSLRSRKTFRESNLNTSQTILVESRRIEGKMLGLTDNYIPVYAPAGAIEGELVDVTLSNQNICWEQR